MNDVNHFPPDRPPYEVACLFTIKAAYSTNLFRPPTDDAERVSFAPAIWMDTPVVVVRWSVKRRRTDVKSG